MVEQSTCTICASSTSLPMFTVDGYRIMRCRSCGHGYVAPMPTAADLDRLYSGSSDSLYANGVAGQVAEYLDADPARFLSYYADRFALINRSGVGAGATILDFGCTNGTFVAALTRAGYTDAAGYDIADTLVSEGRRRLGVNLHTGDLDQFICSHTAKFDAIHSMNVFEHVPDPKRLLSKLEKCLKPRGAFLLSVPNTASLQVMIAGKRSPIIAPPHHLQYFSPRSLATLVEALGFQVRSVETPFWGIEADTYLTLQGTPRWVASAVRVAMQVPAIAIRRLNWGGAIMLIAVRT